MNFNSLQYLLFLPCVLLVYYLLPYKLRNGFLLLCSYFFYICWEARYALLMLSSTAVTYACSLLMAKRVLNRRKLWLVLSLVINLLILFFFKYFNFFSATLTGVLASAGLQIDAPTLSILLPVGISFYTFQALGYTMDVYRGDIEAERGFIDYALFVSFFPQLVAGPIERSPNLLPQMKEKHSPHARDMFEGLMLFFWGMFKKVVVADNLAVLVNFAFDAPAGSMTGMQYAVAAVSFSMQIYCDFSAYSDIARGSAQMLGFRLMRNFNAPYLSSSIKDFWRCWHISLSTWFKDYLYFPLGGSRRGKARVCLNLMVVFLVSGLWHGAALTFVLWGFLHGAYQVASTLTKPLRERMLSLLHISQSNPVLTFLRWAFTFALVVLTFVFFRAQSIPQGWNMIASIFRMPLPELVHPGLSAFPMPRPQLIAVICSALLVFTADAFIRFRPLNLARGPILRYAVYFFLIAAILLFGYYGSGYNPQEFIYFQF